MSFEKHSNFNKQANFTEVKFGENKPVLEVELNELQQIQNEARADVVRDSIPSGFTQLGEIDYKYCLNNENKIKLKTDSVAYVNGYRINIPKDTIIDIGKAPEKDAREDLLFLEVWKEEVTSDSVLTVEGGEGQTEIPNNIKDSRYPIETTHRVALKWRIRHVADVDFSKYNLDGITSNSASVSGDTYTNLYCSFNGDLVNGVSRYRNHLQRKVYNPNGVQTHDNISSLALDDCGLFIAGVGNTSSKTILKTYDGYAFAIPMFRLYRKPSCGKSIPFEYSKINPKVDYSKFTKLVQDEKVERVVTENIQGRSLVNLARRDKIFSLSLKTGESYNSIKLCDTSLLKLNTPYTLSYSFKILTNNTGDNLVTLNHGGQFGLSTGGDETIAHPIIIESDRNNYSFETTDLSVKVCKTFLGFADYRALTIRPLLPPNRPVTGEITYEIHDLVFIEGDWTNKEIPEFFTGLKSLGEDDGNLVTVKNNILNDDTYDINDGNQKLNTFSEVTHILSENTIIPKVGAVVKKGEQETPLEKLGTKLDTDGTEIVEFTKIEGKTLQNLIPKFNIAGSLTTFYIYDVAKQHEKMLKPNTDYTMVVFPSSSKINKVYLKQGVTQTLDLDSNNMALFTTIADPSSISEYIHFYTKSDASLEEVSGTKIMLLEGDYTKTPLDELPFVEGIKSVGENEDNVVILSSVGKNLFNPVNCKDGVALSQQENLYNDVNLFTSNPIKVTPNSKITLSNVKWGWLLDSNLKKIGGNFGGNNLTQKTISIPSNCHYIRITSTISEKNLVQIEYGESVTDYAPHNSPCKQEIHLKEPLRSLPNGVCDEIVGNKVIRRVGKLDVLYESKDIGMVTNNNTNTHVQFNIPISNTVIKASDSGLCDNFPTSREVAGGGINFEGFTLYFRDVLVFRILRSKLTSQDEIGFATWLKENPTTVYYELANPVEEYLENVYDKESIKTYQLDAPLRSLPNGVKDEIKDGVLIRRCGEVILDDTKNIKSVHLMNDGNTVLIIYAFKTHIIGNTNLNNNTKILADKFNVYLWTSDFETNYTEGIVQGGDEDFYVKIPKYKLSSLDSTGWKAWLKENPIKIVYALDTPIEIPLTETKPQTANFSIQRQFVEGNWLRELPNGVKDTVENGKVVRRVGKITLNGTENWANNNSSSTTTNRFILINSSYNTRGGTTNCLCSKSEIPIIAWSESSTLGITISEGGKFFIYNSETSTEQAFKTWLSQNPITLIYELAIPTEEALSTDNYMTYPCHDFNTFCGSIYVGEGRNYIINDNKLPSENPVIIETDFREIEGNIRVEDCKYKKCDDGYNTPYISSSSKNLLDISTSNIITKDYSKYYRFNYTELNNGFTISNNIANSFASIRFRVYLKAGVSYRIEYAQTGPYSFVDLKTLDLEFICNLNSNRVFKVTNTGYYSVNFYCTSSVSTISTATFTDIRITEGETSVPFEPCNKTTKYLENTEENDIEDLRHLVSLTGFNYDKVLNESFDKLLNGTL